jgi:CDP-glucose 4,6-dehydratase
MEDLVKNFHDGFYAGRRCFLTGHTGFKGAWLAQWLHLLGAKVTGYALDPATDPSLFDRALVADALEKDVRGDIREYGLLATAMQEAQPEVVFHLAAQPLVRLSYQEPKATFDINVGGTVNVLEAARQCPSIKSIVVITTDKCYENREWTHAYREEDALGGHDPYSGSKGAAEIAAGSYRRSFFTPAGIGMATARAGNVIGGGDWAADRIIPDAVRSLEAGVPIPVRNPGAIRPWQHVLEPLSGYLALGAKLYRESEAKELKTPGAWNFAPYPDGARPVRDVIEAFLPVYGTGSWEDLSTRQNNAPHEAGLLILAWDKAFHGLGWKPRWRFDETVRRTARWYQRYAAKANATELCKTEILEYMAAGK